MLNTRVEQSSNNRDEPQFGKVAVLFGGDAAEREVSLKSGDAVANSLESSGINVCRFDPAQRDLTELRAEGITHAVNMVHGRGGEDGVLQGALQSMGVPFTGSGVLGSALCMDKVRSKLIFQSLGIPTAAFRVVDGLGEQSELEEFALSDMLRALGGIVMVKPALEGSSIGMSKAGTVSELRHALTLAAKHDEQILVEQFIPGNEYTVAILDGQVLPAVQMITPRDFYDYEAKYHADTTEYRCPCGLSDSDEAQLGDIAWRAFRALHASGWGRVDVMRDESGQFYVLEVNTVPGMTEKSLVPLAAKQAGLSFEALCLRILQTSVQPAG